MKRQMRMRFALTIRRWGEVCQVLQVAAEALRREVQRQIAESGDMVNPTDEAILWAKMEDLELTICRQVLKDVLNRPPGAAIFDRPVVIEGLTMADREVIFNLSNQQNNLIDIYVEGRLGP
jgi:hypothetical protein